MIPVCTMDKIFIRWTTQESAAPQYQQEWFCKPPKMVQSMARLRDLTAIEAWVLMLNGLRGAAYSPQPYSRWNITDPDESLAHLPQHESG